MKKRIAGVRAEQGVMGRGRPREFDTDAALEKAMRSFWAKVRIPAKVNGDSEGNANGIPG